MQHKRDAATAAGVSLAPNKNAPANKGKGEPFNKPHHLSSLWRELARCLAIDAAIAALVSALAIAIIYGVVLLIEAFGTGAGL